jgi:hypothetical protein
LDKHKKSNQNFDGQEETKTTTTITKFLYGVYGRAVDSRHAVPSRYLRSREGHDE